MEPEARIIKLLVDKYGIEEGQVTPEATMTELGLDSLSISELAFDIEDLFDIVLTAEGNDFATFGSAVDLVERQLESKNR